MDSPSYTYRAKVLRCVDGDTVELDIDAGLYIMARNQMVRLEGVDTPEMRGAERAAGQAATDWLRERIDGREVIVETKKNRKGDDYQGKFGRWIARIWIDGECVNDELLAAGMAVIPRYL